MIDSLQISCIDLRKKICDIYLTSNYVFFKFICVDVGLTAIV
jgi:hypothetical protein